jgi:hypothetical protein
MSSILRSKFNELTVGHKNKLTAKDGDETLAVSWEGTLDDHEPDTIAAAVEEAGVKASLSVKNLGGKEGVSLSSQASAAGDNAVALTLFVLAKGKPASNRTPSHVGNGK